MRQVLPNPGYLACLDAQLRHGAGLVAFARQLCLLLNRALT